MKKLNIGITKKDWIYITRYIITGIIILTILQKLYNQKVYENLTDFLLNFSIIIFGKEIIPIYLIFIAIIIFETFIIIGLYNKKLFTYAIIGGISLFILGSIVSLISLIYGLKNNCGCGLFGDNPYLLLSQKLILLTLILFVWKFKNYYFISSKENNFYRQK